MSTVPDPPLPPTTTHQEDVTTAGQRRINMIWEVTQSVVTLLVVISNMIVAVANGLRGQIKDHPVVLSSALFLILGFYYSRTNHAAIGGVGRQNMQRYEGR